MSVLTGSPEGSGPSILERVAALESNASATGTEIRDILSLLEKRLNAVERQIGMDRAYEGPPPMAIKGMS